MVTDWRQRGVTVGRSVTVHEDRTGTEEVEITLCPPVAADEDAWPREITLIAKSRADAEALVYELEGLILKHTNESVVNLLGARPKSGG